MKRKEFDEKMEKLRFAKEQISPSDEDVEEWCRLQDAEDVSFPSEEGENTPVDLEEWNSPEAAFSKPVTSGHRPKILRIASMAAALALVVTAVAVTGYLALRDFRNADSQIAGMIEDTTAGTEAEGSASAGTSDGTFDGTSDDTPKGEAADNSDGENEGETSQSGIAGEYAYGNAYPEVGGSSDEEVSISGYGDGSNYLDLASDSFTAENGNVVYSDALCGAMDEYGDSVLYWVVVYLFQNGVANEDGIRTEAERLREGGYRVTRVAYDDNDVSREWLLILATMEQIEEFAASDAYGYVLCLYDEGDVIW